MDMIGFNMQKYTVISEDDLYNCVMNHLNDFEDRDCQSIVTCMFDELCTQNPLSYNDVLNILKENPCVWIEVVENGKKNGWYDAIDLVCSNSRSRKPYIQTAYGEDFLLEDYGKTWWLYHTKP